MNRLIDRYGSWTLTLLLGIAVFLFWWQCYPFALSYQEQFQLFLLDGEYFMQRLAVPGGLTRYVSEFLVQFYNIVVVGAAIIALLLMLIHRMTCALLSTRSSLLTAVVSLVVPLFCWWQMGDEKVLLGFVVAVAFVFAMMLVARQLSRITSAILLHTSYLLLLAITYWLAGPLALLLAFWMMGSLMSKQFSGKSVARRIPAIILSTWPVLAMALFVWLSSLMVPYPTEVLWGGIGYYRYPSTVSLSKGFNARTYELIEYDYLVRKGQWDRIIAKADKKMPDLPMSVCATNLALAMKGELGERAFDYYQRGIQGLFPSFEINYNTILVTGETYWQLGLVNTAQRFYFEAMEALPDYNKSSRCIRRLAETNLVNGHYEVSRKYLKLLEKTIFYRKWAQRTMALLGNEQAINAHPVYGYMRQVRLTDDLLFSEQELDKICGQLMAKSANNRMALQYLLLYPILQGDINKFMNYMSYVSQHTQYQPRSCQEAIAFAYASRRQQPPQGVVSQSVMQRYNQFTQAYSSHAPLELYRNTVWYYLLNEK